MKLKDIKSIKDQAMFIMVGINGSWLFEATYPSNQDEVWCKKFVDSFVADYGIENDGGSYHQSIQEHIDDCYVDIMMYRKKFNIA